jgi:hypothetical protein
MGNYCYIIFRPYEGASVVNREQCVNAIFKTSLLLLAIDNEDKFPFLSSEKRSPNLIASTKTLPGTDSY